MNNDLIQNYWKETKQQWKSTRVHAIREITSNIHSPKIKSYEKQRDYGKEKECKYEKAQ